MDALPAVSPDGEWVAFVSNRDGGWKIYAVPASGGTGPTDRTDHWRYRQLE
ncbi:MAG: PD40 domain-containing protein [Anaerolineales bacterium]|nr:PD40 domain-containing protein [Anaerolineales bacterium]